MALERYRLSKGGYPESLASLCPAYLSNPPIDFMDGKALRYRLRGNDSFILYSTGLDCIDDGGVMMRIEPQTGAYNASSTGPFGRRDGPDVLWPRPASPEDAIHLPKSGLSPPRTDRGGGARWRFAMAAAMAVR